MAEHRWLVIIFCIFCCLILSAVADLRAQDLLRRDLFENRQPPDIHTRPSLRSNQSTFIELGISLIFIDKLDVKTQTLIATIWVRVVWYDYSLHWDDADYKGINVLRVPKDLLWNPDVVLSNSALANSASIRGNTLLLVYATGEVLWVPTVKFHNTCELDLKNFPFDEHVCRWHFRSWSHDGDSLKLGYYSDKHDPDLQDFVKNKEWLIVDTGSPDTTGKRYHEEVSFMIRLKRHSSYYVFTLAIPIVLVWALTLILFWLPPTAGEKIKLGSFVVLYYAVLLVHLQWIIAFNGSHVPRIVIFCGHSLLFSGLSLIITTLTVTISRPLSSSPVPSILRRILTSWVGHFLCLGPSRKGVTMGAKLLRSSNVEISINSNSKEDSISSSIPESTSEWVLLATALDRFVFIIYISILSVLVISILLC